MIILGYFWCLCAILCSFLAIFGSLGSFLVFLLQFSAILGQLIQCWYSLPHLDYLPKQFRIFWGYFGLFRDVQGHFWPIFCHFCPFGHVLIIFCQFGLCIKTLFKLYLFIWVIFGWYLCVIWVVFVYGWYGFARYGYNVVHLFPCNINKKCKI